MKVAGPLVTLGAVAALGIGIYAVNVSKESQPAAPVPSTSQAAPPTSQAAPPIATTPAAVPFPAAADYQGKVETKAGVITLDISVKGAAARAYACDGKAVETWLSGPADAGVVNLTSKDKTSHLEGRHDGKSVAGTLTIGEKSWPFTAFAVQPPAGLYVSQKQRRAKQLDRRRGQGGDGCAAFGRRCDVTGPHADLGRQARGGRQ
ncbi:hypothetical protein [Mycobacterium sp. 360MFTsu5.1]|uniref:hypothetical protein n=1 Tax=Mycobacterium sp. 360MFTsu5.1 TaxID=1172186 RepID=UPI00039F0AD1|nr:hypothetical protein [Mycobacterium sp. 360MFTsu5.1]